MKNVKMPVFFGIFALVLLCSFSAFAQKTPIAPEKKILIMEIYNLTTLKKFTVSQKIENTTVENIFYAEINAEKELTDAQRNNLRKQAVEIKNRIEKRLTEFASDENLSAQLFEETFVSEFDENFTKEELQEIVEFYRTPTGQKNARFMTTLLSKMTDKYGKLFNQRMQEFVNKIVNEELETFRKQIKETKNKGFDG